MLAGIRAYSGDLRALGQSTEAVQAIVEEYEPRLVEILGQMSRQVERVRRGARARRTTRSDFSSRAGRTP